MDATEALSEGGHAKIRTTLAHQTKRKVDDESDACYKPSIQVVILGGSHSAFSAAWVLLNNVIESRESKLVKRRLRWTLIAAWVRAEMCVC